MLHNSLHFGAVAKSNLSLEWRSAEGYQAYVDEDGKWCKTSHTAAYSRATKVSQNQGAS